MVIGRSADRPPGAVVLLLLGPFVNHVHGLIFVESLSFAFPDSVYSFMVLAALTLLVVRNRAGFVLLGCQAALARNPGAFVLALALAARLLLFRDDRAWTKRTLLWSVGAGLGVVMALLIYFASTRGLSAWVRAIYFEVVPEHFSARAAPPLWQRIPFFFAKLCLLSSLTVLLWPLAKSSTSKLMILVTLGYSMTLMGVHAPHSHYYPILLYGAAGAGLGGLAGFTGGAGPLSRKRLFWIAFCLVAAGTWIGLSSEWLTRSAL